MNMLMGSFDGGSRIFGIAGFIGTEEAFVDLDNRWKAVIDRSSWPSRLSEFHMVECANGEGEFLDPGWTYAQRLALYGELAEVLVETNSRADILAIGAATVTSALHQISAQDLALLKVEGLGTPLDLTLQLLVQQIIHRTKELFPGETIGVLFDEEAGPIAARYNDLCRHYQMHFHLGNPFEGWGYADSGAFTPLQAADLLAYGTMHLAQLNHCPRNLQPHFPVIPAFWKMMSRMP
jgi:hypothetical protein